MKADHAIAPCQASADNEQQGKTQTKPNLKIIQWTSFSMSSKNKIKPSREFYSRVLDWKKQQENTGSFIT